MAYSNGHDPVTDGHEERIQRLEGSMQQVVGTTSATSVKVDSLIDTVKDGFSKIEARFDKGSEQFDKHETEIAALKSDQQASAKRWSTVKGATLPLLAGAAGVIATKFGESIWTWLQKLF